MNLNETCIEFSAKYRLNVKMEIPSSKLSGEQVTIWSGIVSVNSSEI